MGVSVVGYARTAYEFKTYPAPPELKSSAGAKAGSFRCKNLRPRTSGSPRRCAASVCGTFAFFLGSSRKSYGKCASCGSRRLEEPPAQSQRLPTSIRPPGIVYSCAWEDVELQGQHATLQGRRAAVAVIVSCVGRVGWRNLSGNSGSPLHAHPAPACVWCRAACGVEVREFAPCSCRQRFIGGSF